MHDLLVSIAFNRLDEERLVGGVVMVSPGTLCTLKPHVACANLYVVPRFEFFSIVGSGYDPAFKEGDVAMVVCSSETWDMVIVNCKVGWIIRQFLVRIE